MKFFTKNGIKQKIIIAIIVVILVNFMIPQRVEASIGDIFANIGATLLKEVVILVCSLGDVGMGILSNTMLGAQISSTMLKQDNNNLENTSSWLYASDDDVSKAKNDGRYEKITNLQGGLFSADYEIPNMLYSLENIFSNNIAALDINFLNPNKFTSIVDEEQIVGDEYSDVTDQAKEKAKSSAKTLRTTISNWYKSFRNIAIVFLLSVLIYLGIRMLLSSTAADKAKYKESMADWFVALCLVFFIHFIMSAVITITDKFTDLFDTANNNEIVVETSNNIKFKTNLIGLARFKTQTSEWQEVTAYGVIYFVLIIYTFMFTFMYIRRFLYMAFFTMMAPLVAITYPIDKLGDSKAQAFSMWFKEYIMNAMLQPMHLILYTVFVSSALSLAKDNMIYAIVAVGFLIPVEKFIKRMFKLDQGQTTSDAGSFAGGAVTMAGLNALSNLATRGLRGGRSDKGKKGIGGGNNAGTDSDDGFMPSAVGGRSTLGAFMQTMGDGAAGVANTVGKGASAIAGATTGPVGAGIANTIGAVGAGTARMAGTVGAGVADAATAGAEMVGTAGEGIAEAGRTLGNRMPRTRNLQFEDLGFGIPVQGMEGSGRQGENRQRMFTEEMPIEGIGMEGNEMLGENGQGMPIEGIGIEGNEMLGENGQGMFMEDIPTEGIGGDRIRMQDQELDPNQEELVNQYMLDHEDMTERYARNQLGLPEGELDSNEQELLNQYLTNNGMNKFMTQDELRQQAMQDLGFTPSLRNTASEDNATQSIPEAEGTVNIRGNGSQTTQSTQTGTTFGNSRNNMQDTIGNSLNRSDVRKTMKKVKKIAQGSYKVARFGATTAGAIGGAMIGLSSAVASGDPGKVFTNMAAGATAGGTIARSVSSVADPNRIENTGRSFKQYAENKAEERQYSRDVNRGGEVYAAEQAKQRANEKKKKEFFKDEDQRKRYAQMAARIKEETGNQDVNVDNLMKADWDYREAGVKDSGLREKALTIEASRGGVGGENHGKMVDVTSYSTKFSNMRDYLMDDKKNKQLKGQLNKVNAIRGNEEAAQEVEGLLKKLYGVQ